MTTGLADESDGMVLLGWSREKIKNHVTLRSKIGAEILVFAKNFQEGRAPNFGAAAPKNERSVTLRSKIGAEILFLAKNFQAGRAPSNGANAPKNERSVTPGVRISCLKKALSVFDKSETETPTICPPSCVYATAGRDSALPRIFTLTRQN